MNYTIWQQAANGPEALRRQQLARHERRMPPPGEAQIVADVARAATAVPFGGAVSLLFALGRLVDDLLSVRRYARGRAAEEAVAAAARRPGAGPRASWVMGRSARWHEASRAGRW